MPSVILFLFTGKIISQVYYICFITLDTLNIKFVQFYKKNQNKLTLDFDSTYFPFASIHFGFELIRELSVIRGWFMTIKQINMRAITNKKLLT